MMEVDEETNPHWSLHGNISADCSSFQSIICLVVKYQAEARTLQLSLCIATCRIDQLSDMNVLTAERTIITTRSFRSTYIGASVSLHEWASTQKDAKVPILVPQIKSCILLQQRQIIDDSVRRYVPKFPFADRCEIPRQGRRAF